MTVAQIVFTNMVTWSQVSAPWNHKLWRPTRVVNLVPQNVGRTIVQRKKKQQHRNTAFQTYQ
jgi:hypothetical protein